MEDRFDVVLAQSFKIEFRNFHDDVESDEMNDGDFNLCLEG